ncbi:hypothetical protein FB451DRAFT_1351832 [Mycena latifolia]|nr:hypothetical protein FB451DRAFT_1351832 [Mycena latifolia]
MVTDTAMAEFTGGFLLTRLSLPDFTHCLDDNCTLPPTHKRAIIIDALRFDFRIKALTTGSLPTFVDIGNNFGGSSIAEDSIMKQLRLTGKRGVIEHLFPLLEDKTKPFDCLVGHFLGVDHVGRRVGLDHPSMKGKLQQMNRVLERVGIMAWTALAITGATEFFETPSAMWIYSKGAELSIDPSTIPSGLLQYKTFPNAPISHRSIQQIDIVPTLSLLLGLPIPFNNLGSVIPELFWRDRKGAGLMRVLELNVAQIKSYLDAYRSSSSGGELDEAWEILMSAWTATQSATLTIEQNLISIWAQFNPFSMGLGLALLGVGVAATWATYSRLSSVGDGWDDWLGNQYIGGAAIGAMFGLVASLGLKSYLPGMGALNCVLFYALFISCIVMISISAPSFSSSTLKSIPVPLILHVIAFLSNSFTFWEDRLVPFLLLSSITPFGLKGISTSSSTRFHVTFYASSSLPSPPLLVLYLAIPTAILLPWVLRRFLKISRSHLGLAKFFLPGILIPSLVAGTGYWLMEWADSADILGSEWTAILRFTRTLRLQAGEKRQVTVVCYANAFGSSYTIFLAVVYTTTQLTGQLVLALTAVALVAHLEVVDSVRDVRMMETLAATKPSALLDPAAISRSPAIRFVDIVPVALLGLHAFYGTGHQSIIPSIQWKSAFLLTPTLYFTLSGLAVTLNSLGPLLLAGLAVPLLALWNCSLVTVALPTKENPVPKGRADTQIKDESVIAGLGIMVYYAVLLLGTAMSAAILRRHLMVWKVFTPRFMASVLELIIVDVGVLIGFGAGVQRVGGRVSQTFRGAGTQLA